MSGRRVLVTGASRGIGAAIAARLRDDGHQVTGTATSEAGAELIRSELGVDALTLQLTDSESCSAALAAAGAVEVLVNNAGLTRDGLAMRSSEADMELVVQANLLGSMRLSRGVLRGMMKGRWGRIISIGSVVAGLGNVGQSTYAATKAGLGGFSRSLAREVGSRGITVNVVAPGFIETDMTAALDEATQQRIFEQIAAGRFGAANEVAAAVSFLASDEAGYITGETLNVNGGMYMA